MIGRLDVIYILSVIFIGQYLKKFWLGVCARVSPELPCLCLCVFAVPHSLFHSIYVCKQKSSFLPSYLLNAFPVFSRCDVMLDTITLLRLQADGKH